MRLWNWTFIVAALLIAGLFAVGKYTSYNTEYLFPYAFGSGAIATGLQLVVFGPDWDRIIARDSTEWIGGVKLPARGFGFFFMFIGIGMIVKA